MEEVTGMWNMKTHVYSSPLCLLYKKTFLRKGILPDFTMAPSVLYKVWSGVVVTSCLWLPAAEGARTYKLFLEKRILSDLREG